jgi:hypothetical protein
MAGLTFSVLVLGARLRDRPLWIGIGGGWLYVFVRQPSYLLLPAAHSR